MYETLENPCLIIDEDYAKSKERVHWITRRRFLLYLPPLLGVASLVHRRMIPIALVLTLPLVGVVIASALQWYPFVSIRLLLFLVPSFLVLIFEAASAPLRFSTPRSQWAGMAALVSPIANREILQTALPEALYLDRDNLEPDFLAGSKAVVAGPGMRPAPRSVVPGNLPPMKDDIIMLSIS